MTEPLADPQPTWGSAEALPLPSSMSERELEEFLDRAGIPIAPDILESWRLPRVEKVGLGCLASFPKLGVDLHFDRLRESRSETS